MVSVVGAGVAGTVGSSTTSSVSSALRFFPFAFLAASFLTVSFFAASCLASSEAGTSSFMYLVSCTTLPTNSSTAPSTADCSSACS